MNWLLNFLGKDKLILEIIELIRDIIKEENDNKRWTLFSEVPPPPKKILGFRVQGGYEIGHCVEDKNGYKIEIYGEYKVARIYKNQFERAWWIELGDPAGLFNEEFVFVPPKGEDIGEIKGVDGRPKEHK